jgi:hypothetical protein
MCARVRTILGAQRVRLSVSMQTEVRREAEYVAMRATIRERGTARMVLAPLVFTAWAGTAIATSAIITVAVSTLLPLMVLAAGFESIYALYLNVERIGRYLQVFHEHGHEQGDGKPMELGWEHVTMEFGARFPGGPDPLYSRLFMTAVSLNFLPVALGGSHIEIGILAVLHFLVINRMRVAQTAARTQRALDLERFKELRG